MAFKWIALFVFSTSCVAGVVGQMVTSLGSCPKVKTQAKLDIKKYLGTWYEIEAFPNFFESGKCQRAEYSLMSDGHIKVVNTEVADGNVKQAVGDAYRPDDKQQGKLKVRFSELSPYGDYWVIDTNYTNFTMVYSCTDIFGVETLTFAWILSREKTLDKATVGKLESELASYGVKTSSFKVKDQTNCPY